LPTTPVNFGSFTVTDLANRTLTFKLVELPTNVTQQNTFSGVTETIYKVVKDHVSPDVAADWLQNEKFKGRKAIE